MKLQLKHAHLLQDTGLVSVDVIPKEGKKVGRTERKKERKKERK